MENMDVLVVHWMVMSSQCDADKEKEKQILRCIKRHISKRDREVFAPLG